MNSGLSEASPATGRKFTEYLTAAAAVLSLFMAMDMLRMFGSPQLLGSLISLETHYFFALVGLLLPQQMDRPKKPLLLGRVEQLQCLSSHHQLLLCHYCQYPNLHLHRDQTIVEEKWKLKS